MTCNHCATSSDKAAKSVGAPEVEATWAENRDHPRFCPTCHGFLRADGGCTRCETRQRFSKTLTDARRMLENGEPDLAVFVVRDLPETEEFGLSDLAWATYQGNPVRADVEFLLDELEAGQARKEANSLAMAVAPHAVSFTDVQADLSDRCTAAGMAALARSESIWVRQKVEEITSQGRSLDFDRIFNELIENRVFERDDRGISAFAAKTAEAINLIYPTGLDIRTAAMQLGGDRFRLTFCEGVEVPVKPGHKTPPTEAMVVTIGDSKNKGPHFTANVNEAMPFRIEALPTGKITRIERLDFVRALPAMRQALTCGHVLRTEGSAGEETWCRHCDDWVTIGLPPGCDLPLDFGKYQGKQMSEVLETDPDYIGWLADEAHTPEYRFAAETMIKATMTEPEQLVLGFGKYKGESMKTVAETDPDYLRWLAAEARKFRVRTAATMLLQGD